MDILVYIILKLLGTAIYFLPGVLLSYFIFKKTNLIERITYSIILSVPFSIFVSILLGRLRILTPFFIITAMVMLNLALLTIFFIEKKYVEFETEKIDTPFKLICLFSFLGILWRFFFASKINFWGDGITSHVSRYFMNKISETGTLDVTIPDLNFYTGMMQDRANFLARYSSSFMLKTLSFGRALSLVLAVFILCSFVYIVIKSFTKNKKLALLGSAIMAIGPGELLHTTLFFQGITYSYAALLSLFIFYKKEDIAYFWLSLLMSIAVMLTYYTATMVNIIISGAFAFALILKNIQFNRNIIPSLLKSLVQKKVALYLLITLLLSSYIYLFPKKSLREGSVYYYTAQNVKAVSAAPSYYLKTLLTKEGAEKQGSKKQAPKTTMPKASRPYKSKIRFLGLPVITWQDIFFVCFGLTFAIHFFRRKFSYDDKDIAYAAIPAVILALIFLGVKMPERAFSYLSFFGILSVKIPKRAFKIFMISCIIFLIPTSYLVNAQRIKFFTNSNGEIQAAKWVSENLDEIILSDERFISLLIQNDYFKINGFGDDSPHMHTIFYDNDPHVSKHSICKLEASYFATTKRMRDDYILMLNFPSQPMENEQMYEEYFTKIYDNGDVRIYKLLDCSY